MASEPKKAQTATEHESYHVKMGLMTEREERINSGEYKVPEGILRDIEESGALSFAPRPRAERGPAHPAPREKRARRDVRRAQGRRNQPAGRDDPGNSETEFVLTPELQDKAKEITWTPEHFVAKWNHLASHKCG